jgi:nucleotide-binding universal stress UspA family protein
VHDALPLLKKAKHVTLVSIDLTSSDAPDTRIPGAEIATSIARHGVKVEVCAMDESSERSPGEQLLSKAADMSADLIVMGGYGHARWQELVLGGATRTILASMTVPVLMTH